MKKLAAFATLAMITPVTLAGGTSTPPPTSMPEPSTLALFGVALVAVLLLKKFKK